MVDAKGASDAVNVDILEVLGGWTDKTGSGGPPTKQQLFFSATGDKLWGTDAWIEGARNKDRDNLGNKKHITRQRQRKVYIDLSDK